MIAIICFAVGAVCGAAYFALLRVNVELYLSPRRRAYAAGLHLARVAALIAVFYALVHAGLAAIGAAFAGFIASRELMVRRSRAVARLRRAQ